MALHVVVLAAGKGTRMKSNLPKVLHRMGGIPILEHVIKTAQGLRPKKLHVIYGKGGSQIRECLKQYKINWIEQKKQLGTGHAVMQALPFIKSASKVLILCGDVPLITTITLKSLIKKMPSNGMSLLTAEFINPFGLGRIIRDNRGIVKAIIEHKDASIEQLQIKEINSGILVTTPKILSSYLPRLKKQNIQGEYYLTDTISLLVSDKLPIKSLLACSEEVTGVNNKQQLAELERIYQKKLANNLMLQGLTLIDPARFDLRGNLVCATNVTIDINNIIEGQVSIGENSVIGPNNFLKNVHIGKNVVIKPNCVVEDAIISDNCVIGPFARIRPGTKLLKNSHIGNFVELKNTIVGQNSKANHLSYLGDTVIGKNVNVGAGTITCNYDGKNKHRTVIGDGAFIGSNASLVAPIKIGKDATIGAGSTITEDAPSQKLTLARAKQIVIKNWKRK